MSRFLYVPYHLAQSLLLEGDVLLFAGSGIVSALIKISGVGEYSHVAVASKHNGDWEAVEYREWYGGRIINLLNYIKECKNENTRIDVYRPSPKISYIYFDSYLKQTIFKEYQFDGKKITDCMRKLTGLPYSYKRLWLILKMKLFKWKILTNIDQITKEIPSEEPLYPVCSTVVAHCFSKNGWPILKRRSDEYIEPSHFSISPRLNYIFTLDL